MNSRRGAPARPRWIWGLPKSNVPGSYPPGTIDIDHAMRDYPTPKGDELGDMGEDTGPRRPTGVTSTATTQ